MRGTLFIVGTPIGNLDDLSPRAKAVLGSVDVVAAEDTRRTGRLLAAAGLTAELVAHHEHNELESAAALLERLGAGESIALVSDAGMPLVSDPGWALVARAREQGFDVESVPGPCAVTAALSVSGLPTDRYAFEGFLPRKRGARAARLTELVNEPRTLVFFESVHRLEVSLDAMIEAFGAERRAAVARELTKLHEATYTGTLGSLRAELGDGITLLGEFVILVAGAPEAAPADATEVMRVYDLLSPEMTPRRAVALTASITGQPRNEVYRLTRARDASTG